MSLGRLWAFLAVGLPVLGALLASLPSVDLAYQLRAGAQILDGQGIPSIDAWTFTAAGLPWTDQQWGAQVVLAVVYRLAGWAGLAVLRAALVGIVFWALFEVAHRKGLPTRWAAWLALAAFLGAAVALALRPQLLAMALFALVLLLVADRRAHPRRVWAVPVLVLVWANVHGSFFLGPLVLGLAWLADVHDQVVPRHRMLGIAVASSVAAGLTPAGPAVWAYAVGMSTNPAVTQRIAEWQPTSLRDVPGLLFFASALAIVALIARRGRPVGWPNLLWLAVFFFIGAYAVRGLAWWSLGVVPVIAEILVADLEPSAPRDELDTRPLLARLNAVIAMAIAAAALALLPLWRPVDPGLQAPRGVVANAPSGLTAAIRDLARPGDRLFQPQVWGSWFEFAVPDLPVAIDSRIELFPLATWDAYERVIAGAEGWQAQLKTWAVTIIVVSAAETDFAPRLSAAGWRTVYTDADGSIVVASDR